MRHEDDEEPRKLTLPEIALMHEVVRWRRDNDVTFYLHAAGTGFAGAYGFGEWQRRSDGKKALVAFERERPDSLSFAFDSGYQAIGVETVIQAVDILVAVGILPARFSSAYRAGWDARNEATDADGALDLITWPELAPAVEPTW
jgi:hypothetical protein